MLPASTSRAIVVLGLVPQPAPCHPRSCSEDPGFGALQLVRRRSIRCAKKGCRPSTRPEGDPPDRPFFDGGITVGCGGADVVAELRTGFLGSVHSEVGGAHPPTNTCIGPDLRSCRRWVSGPGKSGVRSAICAAVARPDSRRASEVTSRCASGSGGGFRRAPRRVYFHWRHLRVAARTSAF